MSRPQVPRRRPLQQQVVRAVRGAIAAETYADGRLPPERDLADQFDVSRVTVRRALDELERERVITRVQGRGTFVRAAMDDVARVRTMRLGALHWVPIVQTPGGFYGGILRAAMTEAAAAGYAFLFSGVDREGTIDRFRRMCRAGEVDGNMLLGVTDRALLEELAGFGLPTVLVDHQAPGLGVDAVTVDSRGVAVDAVRYLASLGHRRIGYLDWTRRLETTERLEGYLAGLEACGLPADRATVVKMGLGCSEAGDKAMQTLLARRTGVTAVLAHASSLVEGAVRCASDHGLRVPEDLSVITFAAEPPAATDRPRVTQFYYDRLEMGRQATRRLLALIEDPSLPPEDILLEWQFDEGETCASPAKQPAC